MSDLSVLRAVTMNAKAVLERNQQADRVALIGAIRDAEKLLDMDQRHGMELDQKRQKRAAVKAMKEAASHKEAVRVGWEGGLTASEIAKEFGVKPTVVERQLIAMCVASAGDIQSRFK